MTDETGKKHWCIMTMLQEDTLNSFSCPQFPARYIHGTPSSDTTILLKIHEVMVSTEVLHENEGTVVYVEPSQSSSLNTDFRPELALGPDTAWGAEIPSVTCSGWCSVTRVESYPWWSLKLSTPVIVYSLSISARHDAHALRLFNVEVSVQLQANKYSCADIIFIPPGENRTFTCGMNYGRYVIVKLKESPAQLSLCKVKLKCLSSITKYHR
uniref:Fucolectin tachylectin-4 pentraxin-1 domain-containing protein n=1 Tax=Eptatretus burgeri TaxID=7764 RepID=A0A8C4Q3M7_EPTBU